MIFSIHQITITLTALMYLGFGLALFFYPVELLKNAGISLTDPVGIMEARSFYGGLEIGLGSFILALYYFYEPKLAVLLCIFLLFFTLLGRFYGLFVDGAWSRYFVYAVLIEGTFFILNIFSYFKLWDTNS